MAIDSARRQTYPNLEIVISDNASEDATANIVSSVAAQDERVRYVRQPRPLTSLENHRAVWELATGEYFAWLADDDLLDVEFVPKLVAALEATPEAVLAFGDIVAFTDYDGLSDAVPFPYYDFGTYGRSAWRRLWKNRHGGYEMKGLFRRGILEGFGWYDHTVSPDWPLVTYLMLSGEIIKVPGATMYNGSSEPKSGSDRAQAQSFSKIERFPTATVSWRCGLAARDAAVRLGRRRSVLLDAAITFASLLWFNRHELLPNAVEPMRQRARSFRQNI
ncbi:MAG: glycosyltransferase [Actinomycetota bacterium]|nr:glycosyltransferase [Actinomycetota bacterium]